MRTLLLLRHGKAEESAAGGDHARALKKRGRADAADLGSKLASLALMPDLIVTSDARRAEETARLVARAAGYAGQVTLEPDIYQAHADTLLGMVRALPATASTVLMVGHNPGFGDLVAVLVEEGRSPVTLPTCRLAHIQFSASNWKDVRPGAGHLVGFHTPD